MVFGATRAAPAFTNNYANARSVRVIRLKIYIPEFRIKINDRSVFGDRHRILRIKENGQAGMGADLVTFYVEAAKMPEICLSCMI
jgi:hypothetical protein